MPYIKRDEQGNISAVSETVSDGFDELLEEESVELEAFLNQWQTGRNNLNETDLAFVRVLEDVIELLISKNLICFTDLPEAARTKMQQRQRLREVLTNRLDLLDDPEDF
jgi:esterase/lipase superfamily enzyme